MSTTATKRKKKTRGISDHLDAKYGKVGSASRTEFTENAYNYMIAEMLRDARKKAELTQKELADRLEVSRPYISKIERAQSDIQMSTFYRFVKGLGGKVNIDIQV